MAGMNTTSTAAELDAVDLDILMFIVAHLETPGYGPLWREVRNHLGWSSIDGRQWWQLTHRDAEARREFHDAWRAWRDRHQDLPKQRAHRTFHREAFEAWRTDNDLLKIRLERLRDQGYITYTIETRSLDISAAGFDILTRGEPEAATGVKWGQIKPGAPFHAFRQADDGRWSPLCHPSQAYKDADLCDFGDAPGTRAVCKSKRCGDAFRART
jgi:hypothetical protein